MIHYWLGKLADAIDSEAGELEDVARRWARFEEVSDGDRHTAKVLRTLAKIVRRVTAEADAK